MIRSVSIASLIAASLAFAPAAFAKPIKTVEHFNAGKHRHVTEKETVHTKTGVIDFHTKITKLTKADVKETKTISEKETPAATGGYTFSKTVTGFDGKTTKSSGTVSASGHSSTTSSTSSGGHATGGHGKA